MPPPTPPHTHTYAHTTLQLTGQWRQVVSHMAAMEFGLASEYISAVEQMGSAFYLLCEEVSDCVCVCVVMQQ